MLYRQLAKQDLFL